MKIIILLALFMFPLTWASGLALKFPDGKVKLCLLGDMGTGGKTQQDVADALKDEKCHSMHFLGDLIYPSGISSLQDPGLEAKFLKYYRDLMTDGHRPKISLVLGNHDHEGRIQGWAELAKKDPRFIHPSPYFLLQINDLCLVHLDTSPFGQAPKSEAVEKQIQWITSIQEELKSCTKKIALAHHPYLNPGPRHGPAEKGLKHFYETHIIGAFDFLVVGHEHILADLGKVKETQLIISGAGGKFTRPQAAGYMIMEAELKNGKTQYLKYSLKKLPVTE